MVHTFYTVCGHHLQKEYERTKVNCNGHIKRENKWFIHIKCENFMPAFLFQTVWFTSCSSVSLSCFLLRKIESNIAVSTGDEQRSINAGSDGRKSFSSESDARTSAFSLSTSSTQEVPRCECYHVLLTFFSLAKINGEGLMIHSLLAPSFFHFY